jgi:hypothetical protein
MNIDNDLNLRLKVLGVPLAFHVAFPSRARVVLSAVLLAPRSTFAAAGCRCDHSRQFI